MSQHENEKRKQEETFFISIIILGGLEAGVRGGMERGQKHLKRTSSGRFIGMGERGQHTHGPNLTAVDGGVVAAADAEQQQTYNLETLIPP